jgi:ABC-type uncharacterized transport system permease subunit
MIDDVSVILDSAARLAAPLLFVALGELVAERAGALNISVEAMMLSAAYGGALGSSVSGSPTGGLLIGVGVGLAVAWIHAQLSHRLSVNQFVVGLALNLLALGLTSYLLSSVEMDPHGFGTWSIPVLSDLPLVGTALFEQAPPFYTLYVLVPSVAWLLWRSRWGLEVRSAGEDPDSATVTGVDVRRRRREAIYLCGILSGLGGAYLSVGVIGGFSPNMTAGRGFIAIAAVIFGGWTIRGTVLGCVLFGGADALRLALPAIGVTLTPQLLISAPYLLAIVAMLFFPQGKRQPIALGRTFEPAV